MGNMDRIWNPTTLHMIPGSKVLGSSASASARSSHWNSLGETYLPKWCLLCSHSTHICGSTTEIRAQLVYMWISLRLLACSTTVKVIIFKLVLGQPTVLKISGILPKSILLLRFFFPYFHGQNKCKIKISLHCIAATASKLWSEKIRIFGFKVYFFGSK